MDVHITEDIHKSGFYGMESIEINQWEENNLEGEEPSMLKMLVYVSLSMGLAILGNKWTPYLGGLQ